jgi:hypothetical protein
MGDYTNGGALSDFGERRAPASLIVYSIGSIARHPRLVYDAILCARAGPGMIQEASDAPDTRTTARPTATVRGARRPRPRPGA